MEFIMSKMEAGTLYIYTNVNGSFGYPETVRVGANIKNDQRVGCSGSGDVGNIFSPFNCRISKILSRRGEYVERGQPVLEVDFDPYVYYIYAPLKGQIFLKNDNYMDLDVIDDITVGSIVKSNIAIFKFQNEMRKFHVPYESKVLEILISEGDIVKYNQPLFLLKRFYSVNRKDLDRDKYKPIINNPEKLLGPIVEKNYDGASDPRWIESCRQHLLEKVNNSVEKNRFYKEKNLDDVLDYWFSDSGPESIFADFIYGLHYDKLLDNRKEIANIIHDLLPNDFDFKEPSQEFILKVLEEIKNLYDKKSISLNSYISKM